MHVKRTLMFRKKAPGSRQVFHNDYMTTMGVFGRRNIVTSVGATIATSFKTRIS